MSDGGFLIKDSRLAAVRVVGRVGSTRRVVVLGVLAALREEDYVRFIVFCASRSSGVVDHVVTPQPI